MIQTLKIVFFFMYFKMQELGAVLWLFVKWVWKDVIVDIFWNIFLFLSAITVLGCILLQYVLFWIYPIETKAFILRIAVQTEGNFIAGLAVTSFITGVMVLIIAALGWGTYEGIRSNWRKVLKFFAANWERATIRVTGEKS